MRCPDCGHEFLEEEKVCPYCGTSRPQAEESESARQTEQPLSRQTPPDTGSAPVRGMKWHKFLIYFLLFASALLWVNNALVMLTGRMYGTNAGAVYEELPAQRVLDLSVGVLYLGSAALAVYTRMCLARFKKDAPRLLLFWYVYNTAVQLTYLMGVTLILKNYGYGAEKDAFAAAEVLSNTISNTISLMLWIVINKTYYGKRKDLFVN